MKRKRMIKGLMACGIPRNEANLYAGACSGTVSHCAMGRIVLANPMVRLIVAKQMAYGCRQLRASLRDVDDGQVEVNLCFGE